MVYFCPPASGGWAGLEAQDVEGGSRLPGPRGPYLRGVGPRTVRAAGAPRPVRGRRQPVRGEEAGVCGSRGCRPAFC